MTFKLNVEYAGVEEISAQSQPNAKSAAQDQPSAPSNALALPGIENSFVGRAICSPV